MRGEKPWRNVIISTAETLRMRWFPRIPGQPQFWGPSIVDRVVIDEFHRLRLAGLGPGLFTNPITGGVMEISEQTYPEQIARMIMALNATYRWALTATPLVSSVNDCVSKLPYDASRNNSDIIENSAGSCVFSREVRGWKKTFRPILLPRKIPSQAVHGRQGRQTLLDTIQPRLSHRWRILTVCRRPIRTL
jgi:hypothetical protein